MEITNILVSTTRKCATVPKLHWLKCAIESDVTRAVRETSSLTHAMTITKIANVPVAHIPIATSRAAVIAATVDSNFLAASGLSPTAPALLLTLMLKQALSLLLIVTRSRAEAAAKILPVNVSTMCVNAATVTVLVAIKPGQLQD